MSAMRFVTRNDAQDSDVEACSTRAVPPSPTADSRRRRIPLWLALVLLPLVYLAVVLAHAHATRDPAFHDPPRPTVAQLIEQNAVTPIRAPAEAPLPDASTPVVVISRTALSLGSTRILGLADRDTVARLGCPVESKRSGPNDLYVTPLANALGEARKADRARRADAGLDAGPSDLVIVADATTPYRLLVEVVFTAGQSDFARLFFVATTSQGLRAFRSELPSSTQEALRRVSAGPTGTATIGDVRLSGGAVANADHVVAGMQSTFRACYNRALAERASLTGSVAIVAKIGAAGDVISAATTGHGLDPALEQCVLHRVHAATFARPNGVSATLTMEIRFAPSPPQSAGATLEPERLASKLGVSVVDGGFSLKAADANVATGCEGPGEGLAVPKKGPDYDFEALRTCAARLKDVSPDVAHESTFTLTANRGIDWQTLATAIAALRARPNGEPLFPDVRFGMPR